MVESFGCLIIFYIGLKCHFNYFVLYIYIYIYIYIHTVSYAYIYDIYIYIYSVFFIICQLLISLHNIAVLIIICRFETTLLLKYANPCRNRIMEVSELCICIYIYIYIYYAPYEHIFIIFCDCDYATYEHIYIYIYTHCSLTSISSS